MDDLPDDEEERYRILAEFMRRMGIRGIESYPVPMICGQCALVCGPTPEETAERYRVLTGSGLVVPDSDGRMTRVDTFEEAQALRRGRPDKAGKLKEARDIAGHRRPLAPPLLRDRAEDHPAEPALPEETAGGRWKSSDTKM